MLTVAGCRQNVIRFQNQLAKGRMLKLNCSSKNDIIGTQFVADKDISYEIRFYEAAYGKTKWFCNMYHGPRWKYSQHFRAYKGVFFI